MSKREQIVNYLNELCTDDIVSLHREYCHYIDGADDIIYMTEEFNEIFNGHEPEEIANQVFFGNYNPNAPYFTFDGYGNIQCLFSYEVTHYIDIEEIADYIIDTDNALYNEDLRIILNENTED